jgi:hypothetical protein
MCRYRTRIANPSRVFAIALLDTEAQALRELSEARAAYRAALLEADRGSN